MRVSEPETLSLQKSAKNRGKNPNSLRSDMRIFAPNADSCELRVSKAPANAIRGNLFPELMSAGPKNNLAVNSTIFVTVQTGCLLVPERHWGQETSGVRRCGKLEYKIVTIHGAHLLVRLRRTRSIGRPPNVENWTKTVLQASLTSVFVQFSPPREL